MVQAIPDEAGVGDLQSRQGLGCETIIKNCSETGFSGVELRTTHAHQVEVALGEELGRRCANGSRTRRWRCTGWAARSITPDQDKLRKDIEATKEYIVLAQEVGATGVKVRPNGLPERGGGGEDAGANREVAEGVGRIRG